MPSTLIIGAGMAGLTAARELSQRGWEVVVLDKGRGVGGRMATRRIEQGRADHGAQSFWATTPEFQPFIRALRRQNVVTEWALRTTDGSGTPSPLPAPDYIGVDGMSAIGRFLSQGLTVRTNEKVIRISAETSAWLVETESGGQFRADSLLVTLPAPQALALIQDSGFPLLQTDRMALSAIRYQPCLAVLVALSQPSRLPSPGAMRFDTGDIWWIADSQQKGISPGQPTVTIHAGSAFSRAHLEADLERVGAQLVAQAGAWIPADTVQTVQTHRWRYSQAEVRHPAPFLVAQTTLPLLFGGDGFGNNGAPDRQTGVETAFISGLRMAEELAATVNR